MKKVIGLMVVCFAAIALQAAPQMVSLGFEEMARYGATDAAVLRASDMTESVANVAQTNTVTIYGPCSWEYRGYVLDRPFDTILVTNVMSLALTATLDSFSLVSAAEAAEDSFRTYKAIAAPPATVTTTGPATNLLVSTVAWPCSGTVTNGATATLTLITGAPGAAHTLNNMDTGQARWLFRIVR